MALQRQHKAAIFRKKVYQFNNVRNSSFLEDISLSDMCNLIDIIPDALIGMDSLIYASNVEIVSGFNVIEEYLQWLRELSDIIYHGKYFNSNINSVLSYSVTVPLSEFLIDTSNMVNNPIALLHDIRRIIMQVQASLNTCNDLEIKTYYLNRLDQRFNTIIVTPVVAIAQLAGEY